MRRNMILAAWLVLLGASAGSTALAANVSEFVDFSLKSGATTLLPGRLFVPPEAVTDPGTLRPLMLYLHGGGEVGTDNLGQIAYIDLLLDEAKRRGAYLYAPQSTTTWNSTTLTDRVKTMIDRAVGQQHVNADRLYVTGVSNGGGGAWNMLSRFPDTFAAGVPLCGIDPASDFVASRLIGQHVAAFHARNDPVVSVSTTRNAVASILNAAHLTPPAYPALLDATTTFAYQSDTFDLAYTEYPTGGHGIWPVVYTTPQLFDWMFSQNNGRSAGDYNLDGHTDGADFLAWQRGFSAVSEVGYPPADGNGDKKVDGDDLAVWQQWFGPTAATPLSVPTPEPSGLVLSVLCCLGGLPRTKQALA